MKRKVVLLFLGLLLLFNVSCSSDDNKRETVTSFVGVWNLITYQKIAGSSNTQIGFEYPTPCEWPTDYEFEYDFIFHFIPYANNNGTCVAQPEKRGTYAYNSDTKTLTFNYPEGTESWKIQTVTGDSMWVIVSENMNYDNDGIPDKKIAYYLKRPE